MTYLWQRVPSPLPEWNGPREEGGYYWQTLEAAAEYYEIDLHAPVGKLPKEKLDIVLYGTRGKEIPITYHSARGRQFTFDREFEGIIGNLQRRYNETNSEYMREKLSDVHEHEALPDLQGHPPAPRSPGGHQSMTQTSWRSPNGLSCTPWNGWSASMDRIHRSTHASKPSLNAS